MKKQLTFGMLTASGLTAYFLILKMLGLEGNFYLRFFNFLILIVGVYLMMRNAFTAGGTLPTYFEGFAAGLITSVIAVGAFLGFLAFYMLLLDPGFIDVLENSRIWGNDLSIGEACFAIFIEGMASGLIISFTLMQYFRRYLRSPGQEV